MKFDETAKNQFSILCCFICVYPDFALRLTQSCIDAGNEVPGYVFLRNLLEKHDIKQCAVELMKKKRLLFMALFCNKLLKVMGYENARRITFFK